MVELEGSDRIVVICRSGGRSALATEWLSTAGFDAANVVGGMQEWAHAGLAVETDGGGPGQVV
jgi:rhodanese-related sulfurtransferase